MHDGNDDDAKHRKQPPAKAKVGATKTVCKKGEPVAKKTPVKKKLTYRGGRSCSTSDRSLFTF